MFWAQGRQTAATHFRDRFCWQVLGRRKADSSKSFQGLFLLASSGPKEGRQQQVMSGIVFAGKFWAEGRQTAASHLRDCFLLASTWPREGQQQQVISGIVFAGKFQAEGRQTAASPFRDPFCQQVLDRGVGQTAASHFRDSFCWQVLGRRKADSSKSFHGSFWLASSGPKEGRQQKII